MGDGVDVAVKIVVVKWIFLEDEPGPDDEVLLDILDRFNQEEPAVLLLLEDVAHEEVAEEMGLAPVE